MRLGEGGQARAGGPTSLFLSRRGAFKASEPSRSGAHWVIPSPGRPTRKGYSDVSAAAASVTRVKFICDLNVAA